MQLNEVIFLNYLNLVSMRNQLTSTEINILATKISQHYILLINHETTSEEFIGGWVF